MVIHLFHDEKVVNRAIELFEKALPGKNIYICFYREKLRFVKLHERIVLCPMEKPEVNPEIFKGVEKIIIHYLTIEKVHFVNKYISNNIPCYWFLWGADLYNTFLIQRGYQIFYKKSELGFVYNLKILIKTILNKLGYKSYEEKLLLSFIKGRITFIMTGADYNVAQKYIGEYIRGKQLTGFNYYPIDTVLGELKDKKVQGNAIWIGNSASYTNNHLYAFEYLSRFNIDNRKVIMPLSYGGTKKYVKNQIKRGEMKWHNNYVPLLNYLPLDKYNELLLSAEHFIFSSWRQEAVGNILIALYLGGKVFLSEKSPILNYFRNMGLSIYSLEKMTQEDLDTKLDDNLINLNRKIINDKYNEKVVVDKIKRFWLS